MYAKYLLNQMPLLEKKQEATEITFLKFNHNNDICRDCNNDVIMEEKDFIEEFTV